MFSKHSWRNILNQVTLSEAEQLHKMGLKPNSHSSFKKKYIQIFECIHCGKLKRFSTTV